MECRKSYFELKQYGDKDVYQDTCGVLVRGWMVRNDEISNTVYGPGTCVDCMDHDVTYECWYGADDAAKNLMNCDSSCFSLLFCI